MLETVQIPAPLGGINAVAPMSATPIEDCVYAWNLVLGESGLDVRPGYAEWVTGLTGAINNAVLSMVPHTGSAKNGTEDRIWAATTTGLWDVSSSSGAPSQVVTYGSQGVDAGLGSGCDFVTSTGHFGVWCDEENGYYVYTESTRAWSKVTQGGGAAQVANVDPTNFVFACAFKSRLWFVEKNSTRAWYLGLASIYGAATRFDFGSVFPHGGTLVGLWNWTIDSGAGEDDRLVAISSSGDVVIYAGTNPADASAFGLVGTWYVPGVPAGRRIASSVGGDILILSKLGALPLSRLLQGANAEDSSVYASQKVTPIVGELMRSYGDLIGWGVAVDPTTNALVVTVPTSPGQATEQLVMSFANRSWWRWRGLPILCTAVYGSELYFGTADGRVCRVTGHVDGVLRTDSSSWSAIAWSLMTAFVATPRHKQIQMMRPSLRAGLVNASVQATARYSYDRTEPTAPSGNGGGGAGAWDSAVWDSAVWGGESVTQPIQGATGLGREVAIALQGNGIAQTTLLGVDVLYTQGGAL